MAPREDRLQEILLHLPAALQERAAEMASREHLSLNLFVAMAIAEKLQRSLLHECLDTSEAEEFPHTETAKSMTHVH